MVLIHVTLVMKGVREREPYFWKNTHIITLGQCLPILTVCLYSYWCHCRLYITCLYFITSLWGTSRLRESVGTFSMDLNTSTNMTGLFYFFLPLSKRNIFVRSTWVLMGLVFGYKWYWQKLYFHCFCHGDYQIRPEEKDFKSSFWGGRESKNWCLSLPVWKEIPE